LSSEGANLPCGQLQGQVETVALKATGSMGREKGSYEWNKAKAGHVGSRWSEQLIVRQVEQ